MLVSDLPCIVDMGRKMFEKWVKYWNLGNTLLAIACVFDPRCKLMAVEYYYKSIDPEGCDKFMEIVKTCMEALFIEYVERQKMAVQRKEKGKGKMKGKGKGKEKGKMKGKGLVIGSSSSPSQPAAAVAPQPRY